MGTIQRPTDYLSRDEIAGFRQLSAWHSTWLIVHCWASILLIWVVCSIWTNPLTIAVGILLIGARQLGLEIINHDAAHFLLFKNHKLNDWVCEWILNRPLLGASVVPYRRYHLEHHRYTQQKNDPDLPLSAPFPISRDSFWRKVVRDLTGQTGYKQRKALFTRVIGATEGNIRIRFLRGLKRFGPNALINLVFIAGFVATGHWYLYLLLWVLPSLTWYQLITRIRNIGEHGAVPDNDDRLRNTRTIHANWLARMFLAPYFVNYHLEHHLQVSCPCYRLKDMHKILIKKGYSTQMELKSGYMSMMRHATSG